MPTQPHVDEKGKTVYSPVNLDGVPLYDYKWCAPHDDHWILCYAFLTDEEVNNMLSDPEIVMKPARSLFRSQNSAESMSLRIMRWERGDSQGRPYS